MCTLLDADGAFPLILEANAMTTIKWWVDASYGMHPDMKSHTGGTMSMGKGSVYSSSIRQKLNTRSSTEAELVGVNDMMAMILWTRHFLECQGYDVTDNILYQDNESAMLLEKNGQRSSTKRTRHIEVRYFFVSDNVKRGRLTIEHCPTGDMIADFFTKPLQGSTFRKLLKLIMNISDDMVDLSPQECVGKARAASADGTNNGPRNGGMGESTGAGRSARSMADGVAVNPNCMATRQRSYADVVKNEKGSKAHFLR